MYSNTAVKEAMLMIRPYIAIKWSTKAWHMANTPKTLVLKVSHTSSISMSVAGMVCVWLLGGLVSKGILLISSATRLHVLEQERTSISYLHIVHKYVQFTANDLTNLFVAGLNTGGAGGIRGPADQKSVSR